MHRISQLAIAIAPFLIGSFATAQQSNVITETVSTPNSTALVSVEGIPRVVRFSGTLAHRSTPVDVTFSLYEEREGGTPLWQETQNVQPDSQGRFTVLLGSARKDGLPLDAFVSGKAHWLGMEVQTGQEQLQQPEAQVQQPEQAEQRVLLVGVPYALKAADADTLGGKPASAFMAALGPKAAAASSTKGAAGSTTPDDKKARASATANATTTGSGTTNYIPRWLSSTSLGNSLLYQYSGRIGMGTTGPLSKFEVVGSAPAITVEGYNNATSGSAYGVVGVANSTTGVGVAGHAQATSGSTVGARGLANSSSGTGVLGLATASSGATVGVLGQVSSANGIAGVFNNTAAIGNGHILSGRAQGMEQFAVDGNGTITAKGDLNLNGGFGHISVRGEDGDTIKASTLTGTAVHAIGGESYSTAAVLAEGAQVPGLIATNDDVGPGNPTIVANSTSTIYPDPVISAGGNKGRCEIDNTGGLICTGTKSAAVRVLSGRQVALYAEESPENWFEDFGSAKLVSGVGTVKLDSVFAQTVNSTLDYYVFLTPNGDCKGLYIAKKTPTSFEVHELGGGQSNVSFDYRIVVRRRGFENVRLADVTAKMKAPVLKTRPQVRHVASIH